MSNINNKIDKAQSEAAAIKTQGVKKYIWSREVKMSVALYLISLGVSFVIGAIVF